MAMFQLANDDFQITGLLKKIRDINKANYPFKIIPTSGYYFRYLQDCFYIGRIPQAGTLYKQIFKILLCYLTKQIGKIRLQAGAENRFSVAPHHMAFWIIPMRCFRSSLRIFNKRIILPSPRKPVNT